MEKLFKASANSRSVAGCFALAVLAIAVSSAEASDHSVTTRINADTGLKSWQYKDADLALEFIQVPPDFIRASYAARGLPDTLIETVATQCVFGSIVRNLSDQPLSYRVADWRYLTADGQERRIKTKSEWLRQWHGMGVRFSWSILADDASFAKGDWIQGFTTLAEPHGSRVALKAVWTIEGKRHEKIIPDMQCAPAPE